MLNITHSQVDAKTEFGGLSQDSVSSLIITTPLIKCINTDAFYYKSDMHVRPMRFSILCTPTDSSDKTQLVY